MKKIFISLSLIFIAFAAISAQIRPVEPPDKEEVKAEETTAEAENNEQEEQKVRDYFREKFEAEYQGGLFGYSKKEHGKIGFDEINERMIFFGEDGKEKFSIPFKAIIVVYPSHKKVRAGSGRVIGVAPIPGAGLLGSLIKKKKNYMIVQFDDPDVNAKGAANFLLDTEELLEKAVTALGENAEMKRRGDAYIRKKDF